MFGRYFCFIAVHAFLFLLFGSFALSGESASITASAYVLPAIGFETYSPNNAQSSLSPNWLMRLPSSGTVICRIESENTTRDYYYSASRNSRIILPDIIEQQSTDSCIITLIYSEN